ncbi:MAG: Na+/H+ antiporter subunit [Devosia sp.]|uniref:proton-conducting transporter transmembrane domain-containing protein n=1 Tax=Devosia sp. TaxID=1871048 RepID=UPI002601E4F5|nr:proton-conducting transporter membrane subunit [Devosia sp.]MDB5530598.1 Na+/H+ antiporter subunit [Devosia sp.]
MIVLPVVLGLLGAALALMQRRAGMGIALVVVVAIIACDILLVQRVLDGGPLSMTMGRWLPPFGISFAADMFGAGFALAAALVTLVVLVYSLGERAEDGFYPLVLLLLAGVSGAFLTGDLFNLYVWFEVMLIASFGLLVLGGRPLQLDGAVKYGFINFLATSFFLAALGLLYGLIGTLNMADIIGRAPDANPAAMAGVAMLMVLAFGIKAAVFPLNAWLPASYHTPPAAVSALMAGLLTKVGAYAMLRVLVMLLPAAREQLDWVLAALAIATLVIGPLGAIAETNLRRAIGFLVIGGIGAIMAGIAMPSLHGVGGAGLYIVHAMLTLTALYLVAGLVEKLTGQTDSRLMGGLYATHAPVSILFFIVVLAVAGVPPFLGFWPKLLLLEGGLGDADLRGAGETGIDWLSLVIVLALLVNAVLTLIAGTRLWAHIFWREGQEGQHSEYRSEPLNVLPARERWFGFGAVTVLVAAIVLAGLWPDWLFQAALTGAGDIVEPAGYIAAVGLAGGGP